jgi:hypothetical protein
MHEDVGGDDYVDSDALMMIMIVLIMMTMIKIILFSDDVNEDRNDSYLDANNYGDKNDYYRTVF